MVGAVIIFSSTELRHGVHGKVSFPLSLHLHCNFEGSSVALSISRQVTQRPLSLCLHLLRAPFTGSSLWCIALASLARLFLLGWEHHARYLLFSTHKAPNSGTDAQQPELDPQIVVAGSELPLSTNINRIPLQGAHPASTSSDAGNYLCLHSSRPR